MQADTDFALKMIGEQTLQIRLLNMALEQAQKELAELKEKNDKKKPKKT